MSVYCYEVCRESLCTKNSARVRQADLNNCTKFCCYLVMNLGAYKSGVLNRLIEVYRPIVVEPSPLDM